MSKQVDAQMQKLMQNKINQLAIIKDRENAIDKAVDEIENAQKNLDRTEGALEALMAATKAEEAAPAEDAK